MKTFIALLLFSNSVFAASLYAPNGTYLGEVGGSKWAVNSTANPYGIYGSRSSAVSINNPTGLYGSRSSTQSPNNPYNVTQPAQIEPPQQEEAMPGDLPGLPVPEGMLPE